MERSEDEYEEKIADYVYDMVGDTAFITADAVHGSVQEAYQNLGVRK